MNRSDLWDIKKGVGWYYILGILLIANGIFRYYVSWSYGFHNQYSLYFWILLGIGSFIRPVKIASKLKTDEKLRLIAYSFILVAVGYFLALMWR